MNKAIKSSLDRLKQGNSNFVNDKLTNSKRDNDYRKSLMIGQNPFAAILTCSDSRIVPEIIFDKGLGELFVIRVAGNVANPSSIASIEYAIANLNLNLIVVLGHQNCGGVTSATISGDFGKNLNYLLKHIDPAIDKANSKVIDDIAIINAKLTAEKLFDDSAIISDAVTNKKIEIIPAFYSIETGKVDFTI